MVVSSLSSKRAGSILVQNIKTFLALVAIVFVSLVMSGAYVGAVPVNGLDITGGTNMSVPVDIWNDVDGISIAGTSDDPISVNLSVDGGSLRLTSDSGITYFNGTTLSSNLNITGTIADLNTALGSLQYSNELAKTVNFAASISQPGEVYYPSNGHLYEIIAGPGEVGITGAEAKTEAETRTKYESQGYLATVTSAEENDFIGGRLNGDGWFGAGDGATEGDWKWISGPETGTSFWSGKGSGSAVSGRFSDWASGEPNDGGEGGEDCAQYYPYGSWNDYPCSNTLGYYIVEYGADGDLPAVSSTGFTITTAFPTGTTVAVDDCTDLMDISASPLDHRYDTISLSTNVDCEGTEIDPLFDGWDETFGDYTFRGTFDGNGYTISNYVINDDSDDTGLIKRAEYATFEDIILGGGLTNIEGDYCVGGLVGEAINSSFDSIDAQINVEGTQYVGSIVGCLRTREDGSESSLTNSISSTFVAADYLAGGLIGHVDAEDDTEITVSGNTSDGAVSGNSDVGGFIGQVDIDNSATVSILNNDNSSNLTGQYTVGGIVGESDVDDDGTLQLNGNSNLTDITSGDYAAGIIGSLNLEEVGATAVVDENTNSGDIATSEYNVAGGIVAFLYVEEEGATTTISDNTNSGNVTSAGEAAGGIVGSMEIDDDNIEVTIANCVNSGNIQGESEVGGLVGYGNSTNISNSHSTGNITAVDDDLEDGYSDNSEVGGLIGDTDGSTITDSYATGTISGAYEVGGLIGYGDMDVNSTYDEETDSEIDVPVFTQITGSYFDGAIIGSSEVGGLIGDSDAVRIHQSYADAEIEGITHIVEGGEVSANDMGGLVGYADFSSIESYDSELDDYTYVYYPTVITESYAIGALSGEVDLGGLVGSADSAAISNSYARVEITAVSEDSYSVGGAVGSTSLYLIEEEGDLYDDTYDLGLHKVYATGAIIGTGEDIGGLVGYNDGLEVTDSFWDVNTTTVSGSTGGTPKTTAELKNIDTYINLATDGLDERWDFNDIWGIYGNINDGYPCLTWSDESCAPNSPDGDADGIADGVEAAAPNSGDANNDGTADNEQANVTSFVNEVTSIYTVLEVSDECTIAEVSAADENTNTIKDSGYNYPVGLMNFTINCGENGFTATVKQYYFGVNDIANLVVRKHIPATGAYFNLSGEYGATIQQLTIGGQKVAVASYQVTDGGVLDTDGTVNGRITDPAGLATAAVGAPNTGLKR